MLGDYWLSAVCYQASFCCFFIRGASAAKNLTSKAARVKTNNKAVSVETKIISWKMLKSIWQLRGALQSGGKLCVSHYTQSLFYSVTDIKVSNFNKNIFSGDVLWLARVPPVVFPALSSHFTSAQPCLCSTVQILILDERYEHKCVAEEESWRSIRAEGTEAEIWKAIPAGQARVGVRKKQATQKVTAFVETVETTSITRDLEHITFCAPGNKLGLAVDTFVFSCPSCRSHSNFQ